MDGVVVRGRDEKGALGAGDGERLVADEVRGRILVLDSSVHADLTKGTKSQPKHTDQWDGWADLAACMCSGTLFARRRSRQRNSEFIQNI